MTCMPRGLGVGIALLASACFSETPECTTAGCDAADSTGTPMSTGEPTTASTSVSTTTTATTSATSTSTTGTTTSSTSQDSSGGEETESSSEDTAVDGTSTGDPLCGNGVLDPDEECDGTEACTACMLDNYSCNPLNNAGCPDGGKCSFDDASGLFGCLPFLNDPPGMLHEGNCFNSVPQDQWCDVGLACMPSSTTGACEDGACCVEFCDIFDADFTCAQQGDECLVWFGPEAADGLEWLGVCATP